MEYIGRSNLMTTVDRVAEHSGYQMKAICIEPNCKKSSKIVKNKNKKNPKNKQKKNFIYFQTKCWKCTDDL